MSVYLLEGEIAIRINHTNTIAFYFYILASSPLVVSTSSLQVLLVSLTCPSYIKHFIYILHWRSRNFLEIDKNLKSARDTFIDQACDLFFGEIHAYFRATAGNTEIQLKAPSKSWRVSRSSFYSLRELSDFRGFEWVEVKTLPKLQGKGKEEFRKETVMSAAVFLFREGCISTLRWLAILSNRGVSSLNVIIQSRS